MRFELNQTIHYLLENRPHSAKVMSRMVVENAHEDWVATGAQRELFAPFGKNQVVYSTCHGLIEEQNAFADKVEMSKHIVGEA